MRTFSILSLTALYVTAATASAADPDPEKAAAGVAFFEKKIRPVLVRHCYGCHSAKAKDVRGGLLVDSRDGMLKGGESGPAVVPGELGESLIISALRYDGLEMPPSERLPDSVVQDFEKWIRMGAPDPRTGGGSKTNEGIDFQEARQFWSFRPIADPQPSEVDDNNWPASPIDRFLLAKMEDRDIRPSPPADRLTLVRRAYFDLIGLPPTAAQIEEFVNDSDPQAFARLVDRLLQSRHFGERWGRHWLDVARFAESTGGGRTRILHNAWRFRDYVIESFNRDKPFDRFIVEQIAGDLLPYDSVDQGRSQLTGTSFLVLGAINYELQDKELLKMEVVDEQLDTIGRAFLGMTIGCARCHDHKFDPIPTTDYYALAGIFTSTQALTPGNVSGIVERPVPVAPDIQADLARHQKAVKQVEEELKQAQADLKKQNAQLAGNAAPFDPTNLAGIVVDDQQARLTGQWTLSRSIKGFLKAGYLHDGNIAKGQKSALFQARLPEPGRYEVRMSYTADRNRAPSVPVTVRHADGETVVRVNQQKRPPIQGVFVSLGSYRFEGSRAEVLASNRGTRGHVIVDTVQFIPPDDGPVVAKKPNQQEELLKAQIQKTTAQIQQMESRLAQLKKQAPPSPPLVMSVREAKEPGDCHVCIGGNVHKPGPAVPRGFLTVVSEGPADVPSAASGRLQLARWIASPDNPLTSRVIANRVWYWLFGRGLVATPDNFGVMGRPPSHPELLDWLATRLIEDGWSIKSLVRRIMLSRAYQSSSQTLPANAAADPENRLVWRMNRRRLDAESLRDAILTISGQLDTTSGGSSIDAGTNSEFGYQFDQLGRSVYVPVFRNRLHELFEVFDFADPNLVSGKRNTSTLPTQALYLMNSPFVMNQSRQAAKRLLTRDEPDNDARIRWAYLSTLGRPPTPEEHRLAVKHLRSVTGLDDATPEDAWASLFQALYACIDFRYVR